MVQESEAAGRIRVGRWVCWTPAGRGWAGRPPSLDAIICGGSRPNKTLSLIERRTPGNYLSRGYVNIRKAGAVPLSRETGFSPQKEEHDTKVVLPESRYELSVLPPSLEFVALPFAS